MTSINVTADRFAEVRDWVDSAGAYFESSIESIKNDMEFLEWAANHVGPNIETSAGVIPGWTLDNCARKWFGEFYLAGVPAFPTTQPCEQWISFDMGQEITVGLIYAERAIVDSDLTVSLGCGFFVSWGDERDASVADALNEPIRITVEGPTDEAAASDPRVVRALAATLLDFADLLEEHQALNGRGNQE